MTPVKSTSEPSSAALLVPVLGTMVPVLPDDWQDLSSAEQHAAVGRVRNLLQLRRNLIELAAARDEAAGSLAQLRANVLQLLERLAEEVHSLPPHRIQHMRGRIATYDAKIRRLEQLREQYQLEIDLYTDIVRRSAKGAA